ncbi:MAG TPA: rhodanese-like domain-containing protein [Candidatus Kapabacteria bacterium]|nr:rhodanese-like domain-containing protein [Candidatus Kapabacteria bacterium]
MSDKESSAQRSPRGPLRRAFREARPILLATITMACAYNIFGANAIPWLRAVRTADSTSVLHLDSNASTAGTPAVTATADTAHRLPPPDTAHAVTPTDTTALAKHVADSINAARKDSVHRAKVLAQAASDSLARAERATLLAKLATAKEIDGDVAKKLYDMKAATFIDARPEDHFAEGHIPGAMNVYAEQWQTKLSQIVNLSHDRPIVTYCGGGDACELSHELADHLRELNFKVVVVYMGGIKEWTARKYPVATGAQ